jgi:hypothetical protein
MLYINIMLPEVSESATKIVPLCSSYVSFLPTQYRGETKTQRECCHVEIYKQQRRQETCVTNKKFKAWEGSRSWKMREVNLNSVQGAS